MWDGQLDDAVGRAEPFLVVVGNLLSTAMDDKHYTVVHCEVLQHMARGGPVLLLVQIPGAPELRPQSLPPTDPAS